MTENSNNSINRMAEGQEISNEILKMRKNAEDTFHDGDIVTWLVDGRPGEKGDFLGMYRGLEPLNPGDKYNEQMDAVVLLLQSPSNYLPVGMTFRIDVRRLSLVRRGFPGTINAMGKRQAIQNVFTKATGKNAHSKGASSVNAIYGMLGLNNQRNRVSHPFTRVLPGNRENPQREYVGMSQEYVNSMKNGLNWKKVNGKWRSRKNRKNKRTTRRNK